MKGAYFLTKKTTERQQLERARMGLMFERFDAYHQLFPTAAERDKRADELREEGYDVTTSDGT